MLLTSQQGREKWIEVAPKLIILDKGGTLIDFHEMWSAWAVELAHRLETATGLSIAGRFFDAIGFEPSTRRIDPLGRLALESMAELRAVVLRLLREAGMGIQGSEDAVAEVWYAPDPVAEARPLTDVAALFSALRAQGLRVAVATMDDRAPTEAILAHLGAADSVDVLVYADDGIRHKPAPDMVWAVCQVAGVAPAQSVVVGDAVIDMQMGRAAGAGLVVGVLSGVTPKGMLAPQADVLVQSVAELT